MTWLITTKKLNKSDRSMTNDEIRSIEEETQRNMTKTDPDMTGHIAVQYWFAGPTVQLLYPIFTSADTKVCAYFSLTLLLFSFHHRLSLFSMGFNNKSEWQMKQIELKTQEITDLTIHAVPNDLFLWIMTSTTRVSWVTSPPTTRIRAFIRSVADTPNRTHRQQYMPMPY